MSEHDPFMMAALRGQPVSGETIIDVHGHCAGLEEPVCHSPRAWPISCGALLQSMQRVGVDHLVFSHFEALRATTPGNLKAAHRDTADVVLPAAARLSAHLVLHPWLPEETGTQLDAVPMNSVYVGAKVHGELHDVRANSPRLTPMLKRCEELDLTVLLHVHPADSMDDIGTLAGRFPRLNIILAHLWPKREWAAALFQAHPNLFTDTSLSATPPGAVEGMVGVVGPERVVYGSDASYLSMGGQFSKVACAALPPDVKRRIFCSNPFAALPRLARKLQQPVTFT